jgi:hypothetical protein
MHTAARQHAPLRPYARRSQGDLGTRVRALARTRLAAPRATRNAELAAAHLLSIGGVDEPGRR